MTLQEIMVRRTELLAEFNKRSAEMTIDEINTINNELTSLEQQEREIKAREDLKTRMAGMQVDATIVEKKANPETRGSENPSNVAIQKRGAMYKVRSGQSVELRSSVEGSSAEGILIPSHSSSTVTPYPWNEVSSVLDLVNVIDLPNGSEYTHSFQISTGEAAYTLEPTKTGTSSDDGIYAEVNTEFDQVTIKRNKITALTYMSEELAVLPDANYAALVESNIALAIKKKLAKEVILGDGTGNHFVGLTCTNSGNMNANTYTDKEYAITEGTLFDLLIDFGGATDVENRQVLILNKQTLKEFKKIRGTDKRPVYDITITGNTFTIDGYRGVFSSHIKPYTEASAGEIWAVYGDLAQYDMLNFGGEAVETSREFKFNQGVTAVRGRVYSGGGLSGYKAFLRAKKPATV